MEEIENQLNTEIHTRDELLAYFVDAIQIRESHPENSELIAHEVFDRTHPSSLTFEIGENLQNLRNEFGALEAPGLPDDDSDPNAYRDKLWLRLKNLVNKSRTV